MRALLISYDLKKPGQDYKEVHDAIKRLGPWWHYLDSTWIVATSLSCSGAWDAISAAFDRSDNCLVVDITNDPYQGWLPADAWDWLRQHVRPVAA